VSDEWEGLDYFFEPGEEILVARTTGHVMDALEMGEEELARMARAARERAYRSRPREGHRSSASARRRARPIFSLAYANEVLCRLKSG
jgi:hypothetical protein